jgi:hypothetical protein
MFKYRPNKYNNKKITTDSSTPSPGLSSSPPGLSTSLSDLSSSPPGLLTSPSALSSSLPGYKLSSWNIHSRREVSRT